MPKDLVNFDDLTYTQLVEEAGITLEEWSDRNAHDPGIMLIELFAWLTEMQRFYINQLEYTAELSVLSAAVTTEDYEKLVLELPDVKNASAYFEGAHSVRIAVEGSADTAFILRKLEPYRLIGTEITIVAPYYVKIKVIAEVNGKPFRRDIKPLVESALEQYFEENHSGFGVTVLPDSVSEFLKTLDVIDGVLAIRLDAEGVGVINDGDVKLSPRSILQWGGLDLYVH